ncbi:hypothetical protein EXS62_00715 [Candidatus Kaiserbacteria bacterium]|nr:hypothetical protein [Candidatus Kaiserbacteria bacterium]
MAHHRSTKLALSIYAALEQRPEVSKVCWGGVGHFKGATTLKLHNGVPGQVLVQVCEPGRSQKIHAYTKNCEVTLAAARDLARREKVNVNG